MSGDGGPGAAEASEDTATEDRQESHWVDAWPIETAAIQACEPVYRTTEQPEADG
jgi:hypothetical protein